MVVIQSLEHAHLLYKYGAVPVYTDVNISIPPQTSITLTYNVPRNYFWIKQLVANGPIKNRCISANIYVDQGVEMQNVDMGMAVNSESWECIAASMAKTKWWAIFTNNDKTQSHDVDYLIKGVLMPTQFIDDFFDDLFRVRLHPKDMESIAELVAKKIKNG